MELTLAGVTTLKHLRGRDGLHYFFMGEVDFTSRQWTRNQMLAQLHSFPSSARYNVWMG